MDFKTKYGVTKMEKVRKIYTMTFDRSLYFKAACFMLLSCLLLAINNNVVKYLSIYISPIALVFYKNFASLMLLVPLIPFYKGKVLCYKHFNKYNLGRSIVDVAS